MRKLSLAMVAILGASLLLVSCGGSPADKLNGTWVFSMGEAVNMEITFNGDGTYTANSSMGMGEEAVTDEEKGTFTVEEQEDGTLKITTTPEGEGEEPETIVATLSEDGKSFTATESGIDMTFNKQ